MTKTDCPYPWPRGASICEACEKKNECEDRIMPAPEGEEG